METRPAATLLAATLHALEETRMPARTFPAVVKTLAVAMIAALAGCTTPARNESGMMAPPGSVPVAPAPAGPPAGMVEILPNGQGGYLLPNGETATANPDGGFTLPIGDRALPDGTGGIILRNGSRCVSNGAGGFLCPAPPRRPAAPRAEPAL
jgi:hypothetical protein